MYKIKNTEESRKIINKLNSLNCQEHLIEDLAITGKHLAFNIKNGDIFNACEHLDGDELLHLFSELED